MKIVKDRRALLGVSAHVAANLVIAATTLLTPALLVPILGLDGYAFVAFYLHLAVFLLLFDFGLSGLLMRQLAEFCGHDHKGTSTHVVANLGRSVEGLYWAIGLLLGIGLFAAAGPIAQHWLKVSPASIDRAVNIVRFMAIAFIFHWPFFLYQNALIGLGRQIEASLLSGTAAIARLMVGYLVATWSVDVGAYFGAVAFCNLLIIVIVYIVYHRTLVNIGILLSKSAVSVWEVARYRGYALQLALIMMLGYFLVSVDRLLAAKILPLAQYAEYSIVCTISQGISLATSAVVGASLPRLVQAFSRNDQRAYQERFFVGQLAVCVACVPIYVAVVFYPGPLLELVTRHKVESENLYQVLVVHASGTLAHTLMVLSFAAHQSQQQLLRWLAMTSALALCALGFAILFKPDWGILGLAYFWLSICVMQMLIGAAISARLRYHELSTLGVGRLLTYCVQVAAGIGAGYLTFVILKEYSANFLLTISLTAGVSFLAVSFFMLGATKMFEFLYPGPVGD